MPGLGADRYAEGADPALAAFIRDELLYLSFDSAQRFYREVVPHLRDAETALLGANDRFFLLTVLCKRTDAVNEWLYDRCREVELAPDGYVDLWARFHYKSTIITFAGVIQEILRDPEITIGIFAITSDIATKFLRQIKEEFERNAALQHYYADVLWAGRNEAIKEAQSWSDAGITVKRTGNPKEATIEAYGLLNAMPTGRHYALRIYDDLVDARTVTETATDQAKKALMQWELSLNLGSHVSNRQWVIGTRYCTIGSMRITMADWSQKPISDVVEGDVVVGWELRDGKRYLRPARVIKRGIIPAVEVREYILANGRKVTCTPDHRWWRGPHGGGKEYAPIVPKSGALRRHGKQSHVRQLLVPTDVDRSRDAGWLAGFFDGEGTIAKNPRHPSASIRIAQTTHNPGLIEETRAVLRRLGFEWTETWHTPKQDGWSKRCVFNISGGWSERYRFLAEIAPARREKLADSLYGQIMTTKLDVVSETPAGEADVHWLETETGNYVIEGICSSNSYADLYGIIIDRKTVKERRYPATHDGTLSGRPVFLSRERWAEVMRDQRGTIAAQMLQNPLAGAENTFNVEWLRPFTVRPAILNVYIMADPSLGRSKKSDRTAIIVIGVDPNLNFYLLDGYCHRMKLSQRWERLKELHAKWSTSPGVYSVDVGYERYGVQADIEHFEIEMQRGDMRNSFTIKELNWVNEGPQAKTARIGRLEPSFRLSKFWMPPYVHVPRVGKCTWKIVHTVEQQTDRLGNLLFDKKTGNPLFTQVEGSAQMKTTPYKGPTAEEQECRRELEPYRVMEPIARLDEDGNRYDLALAFVEEYRLHPFAPHDDILDAASRVHDMQPVAPVRFDRLDESRQPLTPD